MSLSFETQAIVLDALPHKERNQIVTLYSPDLGKFSFYMANTKKSALQNGALTMPLTEGLFLVRKVRSDLYRFIEGKSLDLHLSLRKDYTHLESAAQCLELVKKSQWRAEPAPHLYHFLSTFLKWLPLSACAQSASTFFHLKLLKHEGLFHPRLNCCHCSQHTELFLYEAELFCQKHAPGIGEKWEQHELSMIHALFHAKQLKEIEPLKLDATVRTKIKELTLRLLGLDSSTSDRYVHQ